MIGQQLTIPAQDSSTDTGLPTPTRSYTVVAGDSLNRIASRFGTTAEWLRRLRLNETAIRQEWGDKCFEDYQRYLDTCVRCFDQHISSLAQYELRRID